MILSVPVSVGEVVDKITILEIKEQRISDAAKVANVKAELAALRPLVTGGVFDSDKVQNLTDGLRQVNAELWDIEDDIRAEEAASRFGDRFIELARVSVDPKLTEHSFHSKCSGFVRYDRNHVLANFFITAQSDQGLNHGKSGTDVLVFQLADQFSVLIK